VDLVPSAVAELRREHPGLAVTLRQAGRDEAVRLLRGGELDVAVVFVAGEPLDLDGDLAADDLLSEPMLVVLPRTHRLAARRAVRLADLARDRWVRGTQPDGVLDRAAAAAGFEPDVAFETDDVLAVQGLVAAGVAVSLAPGLALANTRDDVVVRPLAGEPVRREIFALTRAGSAPGARAAVAALRRAGAELGARLGMPGARRR
jgi:DNA-binding transcriptional LysR family regulator